MTGHLPNFGMDRLDWPGWFGVQKREAICPTKWVRQRRKKEHLSEGGGPDGGHREGQKLWQAFQSQVCGLSWACQAGREQRCPVSPWLPLNLWGLDHSFLRARDGGDPMKMMICDNQSQQLVFWLTGLFCFLSPRQNVTNKSSPAFAY